MPDKEEERRHIIRATGGKSEHSVQFEKKDPNDHRVSLALAELYELGLIEHWHIVT